PYTEAECDHEKSRLKEPGFSATHRIIATVSSTGGAGRRGCPDGHPPAAGRSLRGGRANRVPAARDGAHIRKPGPAADDAAAPDAAASAALPDRPTGRRSALRFP